jgi:DNA replication licensing factor MCM6
MASSDAGYMMSDAPSLAAAHKRHMGFPSSSSNRPRGPPSENLGAASDDEGDGFADDQVPRSSRIPDASNIPRVEDRIGILVQEHFEAFIERYAMSYPSQSNRCLLAFPRDIHYPWLFQGQRFTGSRRFLNVF